MFIVVMYRNLNRKSSFRSCPYTVLVKCPVRFYSIFDEIGQKVDGKIYFYHKTHCSTIQQNRTAAFSVYLRPRTDMRRKIAQNVFPLWIHGQPWLAPGSLTTNQLVPSLSRVNKFNMASFCLFSRFLNFLSVKFAREGIWIFCGTNLINWIFLT